ncbi:unnamed protein product [Moneuplotes crassus]|uniref:AP2/ERF domain-containing protein n=1 Tax=Euplotes crassus TaxID=5936 RepID=A0AAD1XQP7_EUPCR|nr:unnamed protein product [Moneuplotes crassus]
MEPTYTHDVKGNAGELKDYGHIQGQPLFTSNSIQLDAVNLLKMYCFCDYSLSVYCHCKSSCSFGGEGVDFNAPGWSNNEDQLVFSNRAQTNDSRSPLSDGNRRVYLRTKLEYLHNFLQTIEDSSKILVYGKPKVNCKLPRISSRRSHYTGVFKNNLRWQAFINIRNKKTYIKTCTTQEEAARAFDCMSLLLNRKKAVTNYNYSRSEIYSLFDDHAAIVNKFCS